MEGIDEKTILSAQVAVSQRDQLARLAAAHSRSLSGELRRAVDVYIRIQDPGALPPLDRPVDVQRRGLPAGPAAPPLGSGDAA